MSDRREAGLKMEVLAFGTPLPRKACELPRLRMQVEAQFQIIESRSNLLYEPRLAQYSAGKDPENPGRNLSFQTQTKMIHQYLITLLMAKALT